MTSETRKRCPPTTHTWGGGGGRPLQKTLYRTVRGGGGSRRPVPLPSESRRARRKLVSGRARAKGLMAEKRDRLWYCYPPPPFVSETRARFFRNNRDFSRTGTKIALSSFRSARIFALTLRPRLSALFHVSPHRFPSSGAFLPPVAVS